VFTTQVAVVAVAETLLGLALAELAETAVAEQVAIETAILG
jgi:hypothetical protein